MDLFILLTLVFRLPLTAPLQTACAGILVTVASTRTSIPRCLAPSSMRSVSSTSSQLERFRPHGHKHVRVSVWWKDFCETTTIPSQSQKRLSERLPHCPTTSGTHQKKDSAILQLPFRTEDIQRKAKRLVERSGFPVNVVPERTREGFPREVSAK